MESLSPTKDTFTTQKIMAVLGALCVLYFLFSPLPGAPARVQPLSYMTNGGGDQWAVLGFTVLTLVLVCFRFWHGAWVSSWALLLTESWLGSVILIKHFLVWIVLSNVNNGTKFHFGIFKYVVRFLMIQFYPGPNSNVAVPFFPYFFPFLSSLQIVLLVLGTALLFVASSQGIRFAHKKEKSPRFSHVTKP